MHDVLGWRCASCDANVDLTDPAPWRCPNSTDTDRHHVLRSMSTIGVDKGSGSASTFDTIASGHDDPNPFIANDRHLAWASAAAAKGLTRAARDALVRELDLSIAEIDGVGFRTTPFARSDHLSDALGFESDGGVWVKDETGGVGGSQKARHLFTILLHLRAMEVLGELGERPRLAIASCGNAALAAATLAQAAAWPIDVYVPTWMGDGFADRLDALGAVTHRSERTADDPPGDPAMLRFREAVATGSIPFTVQGPENALCLDGGRTIGWEIARQIEQPGGPGTLDAMFVQVGGGAFAACLGRGLLERGHTPSLMAVQAEGCAPLARAWKLDARPTDDWSEVMPPWPDPHSLADGILDDETYDWVAVLDVMRDTGGEAIVASEAHIERAHRLAGAAGFDASPTGTAGLAGLVEHLDRGSGSVGDRVGVVMSGRSR